MTSTKLLFSQTLNHATFDVYVPKTAETLIHGKCYGYCFLLCEIYFLLVLSKYWIGRNKIVFTLGEVMVINPLVSGVSPEKIKPQRSSKTLFSLQTHLRTYVNLYSFERSMKRRFLGIFFL